MNASSRIISTLVLISTLTAKSFAFGGLASQSANNYALYFIGQTATSLNTIFNCTQNFYDQNNACPSNNYCALDVKSIPPLAQATNVGCAAIITFATQNVSPLVQGKVVGVGPRWIASNNAWSFDSPIIATNINDQPNALTTIKTCTPSQILAQNGTFIGAYYADNVIATLQDKNNNCFTTSKAGV